MRADTVHRFVFEHIPLGAHLPRTTEQRDIFVELRANFVEHPAPVGVADFGLRAGDRRLHDPNICLCFLRRSNLPGEREFPNRPPQLGERQSTSPDISSTWVRCT